MTEAAKHTLTYDWNGHNDMPISGADLSDMEVACKVRMLMRHDLNHESVCTLARDRIMGLSKALEAVTGALHGCLGIFDDAKAKYPDTTPGIRTTEAMERARAALAQARKG